MNLKPLQDWAVIRRSEAEEKTAAGIIIPDTAKEKPLEGVILAIGPGRYKLEKGKEREKKKFVPTVLKPGQRVIYQKYAEREVELGGEVITLIREEDILGTIEDYVVAERKTHAIEEKKDGPVAVREKAHVPAVTAAPAKEEKPSSVSVNKPLKKHVEKKKETAEKKERPAQKKTASTKKAAVKRPAKKTAAKPVSKKTEKKSAAVKKKVKSPAQKAVAVKKPAKKAVAKKPAKPAVKRAMPKKAAGKKSSAKKGSAGRVAKKSPAKGGKK